MIKPSSLAVLRVKAKRRTPTDTNPPFFLEIPETHDGDMAEPEVVLDQSDELKAILALLASAGYPTAPIPNLSPAVKLTGGLAWCVASTEADSLPLHDEDFSIRDKMQVFPSLPSLFPFSNAGEVIEAALRSMECPYTLHAHQIRELDYKSIYPAVKWIVGRVLAMQGNLEDKVTM
ncbi:hypothetical protein ACLOJK_041715 [Asimina triloba]